jgi:5-deoxy-D-glucuronate isomerase
MNNWLFRNTAKQKGRNVVITPDNSAFQFLSVARIVLDNDIPTASGQNVGVETTLLCLHGKGSVTVGVLMFYR